MPPPSYLPGADPMAGMFPDMGDLMRQQRQQQLFSSLGQFGTGLMQAGMGGPYGSRQQGMRQAMQAFQGAGQGFDPMDAVRARYMMGQIEGQQGKAAAAQEEAAAQARIQERLAGGQTMEQIMASPEGRADMAAAGEMDVLTRKGPDILNPEVEAARIRIAQAGKPSTTVNIAGERETEEAKAEGKAAGEFYGEDFRRMQESARASRRSTTLMNEQQRLLEQVYTGTGGPQVQAATKLAKALGVEGLEEQIAAGEAGDALATELLLQARSTAQGTGLPGDFTKSDQRLLERATAGMTFTDEGRRQLFDIKRKLDRHVIKVAKEARAYRKKHGALDEGFYDQIDEKYGPKSSAGGADFGAMTPKDLVSVDIDGLDDAQAAAWLAEMDRRGL